MSDENPTVVVPGGETQRALAWSVEDSETGVQGAASGSLSDRRPLPRALVALLAGVMVCAIGLGSFVIGENEAVTPVPHANAAIEQPPPDRNPGKLPGEPASVPKPPPVAKTVAPAPPPQQPAPPKSAPPHPAAAPPPVQHALPPAPTVQPAPSPQPAPPPPPDALEQFSNSLAQQGMHFIQTPAAEASEAESMCQDLANGGSVQSWITATEQKSTNTPPGGAAEVVHDAIDAYCPQYDNG